MVPLLFNIYISGIQSVFTPKSKWFGFADNLTIYTSSNDITNIVSTLEDNFKNSRE